jgi:hypothetical protein
VQAGVNVAAGKIQFFSGTVFAYQGRVFYRIRRGTVSQEKL